MGGGRGPKAQAVALTAEDRRKRERVGAAATGAQRDALRARIVLRAAEMVPNADELGLTANTVRKWRGRFATAGEAGLVDRPRPGRPPRVDAVARCRILALGCDAPPDAAGACRPTWTIMTLPQAVLEAEIVAQVSARFPHAVRRVLLTARAIRARRDAGELVGHGLAVAIGRLEARTDRFLAGRITHPPNRRLLHHLRTERAALFTFLRAPTVEATNWQAEQAIRPAVVTRKVCGGTRTPCGAGTQQMVASVLRTCWQQQREAVELLMWKCSDLT